MGFRGLGKAATAATLGIGLVVLAGCGGGGEQPITTPAPKSTTTTTVPPTSVTSSPTTTTTPATTPATAATVKGYNGAVAVATAFLKAYNQANRDANTSSFDGLYTTECTDCEALRKAVQGRADKGWHTTADVYTLDDVGIETYSGPDKTPITASVVAMVTTKKVPVYDTTGKLIDTFDPTKTSYRMGLTYSGSWKIVRLKRVT